MVEGSDKYYQEEIEPDTGFSPDSEKAKELITFKNQNKYFFYSQIFY